MVSWRCTLRRARLREQMFPRHLTCDVCPSGPILLTVVVDSSSAAYKDSLVS